MHTKLKQTLRLPSKTRFDSVHHWLVILAKQVSDDTCL